MAAFVRAKSYKVMRKFKFPHGRAFAYRKKVSAFAMSAKISTGANSAYRLTPDAFNAVTSLSVERRPKAVSVATRTAIGIVSTRNDGIM